jgi:hypothetical protein
MSWSDIIHKMASVISHGQVIDMAGNGRVLHVSELHVRTP